jgi:lipopolysaccharide export system protein LptA
MASWHKPTRIGVAIVGLASAAAVYFTVGERRGAPPPQPVQFTNPEAIAEISGCQAERFDWAKKYVEIKRCDRIVYFEDGSAKITNGVFVVPKGEDRSFTLSARETTLGKDESRFAMAGAIRLDDSDGFYLTTDRATFDVQTSVAESPGAVMFGKGRMSGSGMGMTYDQKKDVLRVNDQAQVTTVDEAGKPIMQFSSATTMLDRVQHVLTADMGVHVVRDKQIIDTNHADARLTEMNDVVTFLQLRGDSRVTGGEASIDSMSARDIDLDYTDDGKRLEAVKLAGNGAIAMTGNAGKTGRQIAGETLDLSLAEDGTLTRAVGDKNVRLDLPASADVPQRSIAAQTLDATGQPGKGLTSATFTTDVNFTEQPSKAVGSGESEKRTARAQKLEARLDDDAVTAATFSGAEVTFEETGLKSCSARLEYEPGKGSLQLSGATKGGDPIVAQERVAIEGQTINVALDNRRMKAKGSVRTFMRAVSRCKPAQARPADAQGSSRTPGLLKDDAPVTIVAASLDYDSQTGYAEYTGTGSQRPTLEQGETRITADTLVIDQTKGDLRASGNAISVLTIDGKRMTGRGNDIRYTDERRLVVYSSTRQPDATAAARPATPATELYLGSAADSNLRAAGRIEIVLDAESNTMNRMFATNNIRVVEGAHTVTGGANSTLQYSGATEQYVVKSDGPPPIVVVKRDSAGCRENNGYSVTFSKNGDAVVIDGNQMGTTKTEPSKSACAAAAR